MHQPSRELWRVLNMARTEIFSEVLVLLRGIAQVVNLPPNAGALRECIGGFDAYFVPLEVPITSRWSMRKAVASKY